VPIWLGITYSDSDGMLMVALYCQAKLEYIPKAAFTLRAVAQCCSVLRSTVRLCLVVGHICKFARTRL